MESPIAETKLGKYIGHYVQTLGGRQVAAFNGIRYAKPPLNKLRFKEAQKIEAHEGVYDATKDGDDCVQDNQFYDKYPPEETQGKKYVGSEDCLFLNVYTPKLQPEKPYPVIIFIHGGGYYRGTGSSNWHGPQMLLDKDVILVTITYRLGVFGFLVLDDDVLPSNLGLKDQSLALNWVKDHIANFGGDPKSITITGNSAGGACAEFHMLSPRSKGLISRAISQSGSIRCPWAMIPREKAIKTTLAIASILNCPTTPAEMIKSLQEKTVDEIMTAIEKLKANDPLRLWGTVFAPVIEKCRGGFISEQDILTGSSIPWLAGVNHDEGFLFYRENYKAGNGDLSKVNANYRKILPVAIGFEGHAQQDVISEKIKQFYFGNEDISDKILTQYINMLSDGVFVHDLLQSVRKHKGETYLYLLSHQGKRSLTNELPVAGVCHGDELFYLYPFSKRPMKKIDFNTEDSSVQKLFVELWTNFATYGEPTPKKEETQWPKSNNGKKFISITSSGIKPSENLFSDRMEFWDNLPIDKFDIILKGNF